MRRHALLSRPISRHSRFVVALQSVFHDDGMPWHTGSSIPLALTRSVRATDCPPRRVDSS